MSLKDSDKKAVGSVSDSIKKSSKEFRYLNLDNTFNYDNIIKSRTDSDGEIVTCPVNKIDLYFIKEDGYKRSLHPHGECWCCGKDFSFEALKTVKAMDKPSFPMILKGFFCKTCYNLEDHEVNKILEDRGAEYRLEELVG